MQDHEGRQPLSAWLQSRVAPDEFPESTPFCWAERSVALSSYTSSTTSAALRMLPSALCIWRWNSIASSWMFPGRRIIWIRPVGKESKVTSVYLIHPQDDVPNLRQANAAGDRLKQKEAFAELYSGLGWQTPRVIEQMMKAGNFYSDELVQVKLPKWSQNRVVLLGDAAWAPSPFTSEGNQLAIIGAWVLAQELSRNRNWMAFEMYEKRLRSYVENCQKIPLGGYAPYIFNPQTSWGIWLLRTVFRLVVWVVHFVSWTKLTRVLPDRQERETHPAFDLEVEGEGARWSISTGYPCCGEFTFFVASQLRKRALRLSARSYKLLDCSGRELFGLLNSRLLCLDVSTTHMVMTFLRPLHSHPLTNLSQTCTFHTQVLVILGVLCFLLPLLRTHLRTPEQEEKQVRPNSPNEDCHDLAVIEPFFSVRAWRQGISLSNGCLDGGWCGRDQVAKLIRESHQERAQYRRIYLG